MDNGCLLREDDADPVEIVNPSGSSGVLLECEHAGRAIPLTLGDLGLTLGELSSHIGWDIGAEPVTRQLARELDATAVMQRYSRLVIDCNRSPEAPDSIPEVSHGVSVPGNTNLTHGERESRRREIFEPYDRALGRHIKRAGIKLVIAIHSFTPRAFGMDRPWDIGFLYRPDQAIARRASEIMARLRPSSIIGHNQPYQLNDATDWFIPHHVEPSGLPFLMLEIRNQHIATAGGVQEWSGLLLAMIRSLCEENGWT